MEPEASKTINKTTVRRNGRFCCDSKLLVLLCCRKTQYVHKVAFNAITHNLIVKAGCLNIIRIFELYQDQFMY